MRMRAPLSAAFVALVVSACNAILDNKPGVLVTTEETPTEPAPGTGPGEPPDTGPSELVPNDAAVVDAEEEASSPVDGGARCPPGTKSCHGLCVSMEDPRYGCRTPACTPCPSDHSTASCENGACAVATCDHGFADCNAVATDGCEVSLSLATSCGACGAICPPTTPMCAPTGATFTCTTGCPPTAPLRCGNECVDPMTSVTHCGSCAVACPDVPNATTACSAGVCTHTCKAGYHACAGGTCAVDTDPAACGAACTVCPAPPHAVALCTAGACAFQCAAGYADCNLVAADGCEAQLSGDPANCGVCGRACAAGGTCTNGVCVAPAKDAAKD